MSVFPGTGNDGLRPGSVLSSTALNNSLVVNRKSRDRTAPRLKRGRRSTYIDSDVSVSGSASDDTIEGSSEEGEDDSIITNSVGTHDSSSVDNPDNQRERYHDKTIGAAGMETKSKRLLRGVAVKAAVRGPLEGETPASQLTEVSDTSQSRTRGPGRGSEFQKIKGAAKDCRERLREVQASGRGRLESSSSSEYSSSTST